MAEGGFGYDDPDLDHDIDHDDDDTDDKQEVNTTCPFQPGAVSTPYHGGEQHDMKTMQHEQTGLPPSYQEHSPLLGAQYDAQQSWDALTRLFPEASKTSLETSYGPTRKLQVKMAGFGKKVYNLFTRHKNTRQDHLNPKLPKEIRKALGQRAKQIIAEDRDTIQEQCQRLQEAKKQREAEKIAAEREKELQEMENLKQQTEKIQARIDALQEEHGTNLESETELKSLKQLKKNNQTELENKKKEVAALEKQAKNKQKAQEKVAREKAKLDEIVKKKKSH